MASTSKASSSSSLKTSDSESARIQRTIDRLDALRNQLAYKPRGKKLEGKVCILTGAGSLRGIGRASAFAYAHEGAAHLYLLDFDGSLLPELKESLEKSYPETKVTTIQGDASDETTIAALCAQAIKEEGRLDVFFANAGVASAVHFSETTPELWMRLMRVNTLSCFLALKYGSAAMQTTSSAKPLSSGSIIMTASVAGIRSGAGDSAYSASKAAVNNLVQTGAYQLHGTNVRVNSICPGLVETAMTSQMFDAARTRGKGGKIGQLVPLQRYAVPEEIAQTALFLASDDSSFTNGQALAVDGGLSASHPVVPGKLA